MITERKYKILVWLVIIMATMNISIIGSIVWNQLAKPSDEVESYRMRRQPQQEERMGLMLKKGLNLSEGQSEHFRAAHQDFRINGRQFAIQLAQLRDEMIREMMTDQPDTVKLNQLAEEIGWAHRDLKITTYHYFLKLKNACTPDQALKLERLFRDVMQTETSGPPQHGGKFNRRGEGMKKRNP